MTWLALLGCVAGALAVDLALDPDRRAAVRSAWARCLDRLTNMVYGEMDEWGLIEADRRRHALREAIATEPDPLAPKAGLPSASDWADLDDARAAARSRWSVTPKIACMRTSCEGAPPDDRYPRGWEPHPRSTDICMACYKRDGR